MALNELAGKEPAISKFKISPQLAQQYSINIELLNDINSLQGIDSTKAPSSDLLISIRYGVILKNPLINIAKYGVINLHSGFLPD